jgi:Na+/H+ antiporter NhaD/arsenite permease-like protein
MPHSCVIMNISEISSKTMINQTIRFLLAVLAVFLLPAAAWASAAGESKLDLTDHPLGLLAVGIFVTAYAFVVLEEKIHLRKSKPVLLAAGLIWGMVAWYCSQHSTLGPDFAANAFRHIFLEFSELFFFLIVAMSFVAAMTERNVFEALRAELVSRNLSFRSLFWITGIVSFFLSAVLDNLTTALIMSAVILAVGAGNIRFITLAFINLVVAANAGGAWCAFGDITTLMVWQAKKVEFFEFFVIFLPSLVNWLIPALCMHFALPKETPPQGKDNADVKFGGWITCLLFAITIAITVSGKQFLHMPPVFGMLFGLGLLQIWGYFIKRHEAKKAALSETPDSENYNVFEIIARAEWDTLLFFYGVLLCVGGLATLGYLELASTQIYGELGFTTANVIMGLLSAIVDNIPIMYAVLQMSPAMDHGQWLLITLTAGVGGSLLSVGSAAGVALMGVSKGQYTFMGHLKWSWAIALGYIASIYTHLWINASHFTQ